jgi:hypothetical protein
MDDKQQRGEHDGECAPAKGVTGKQGEEGAHDAVKDDVRCAKGARIHSREVVVQLERQNGEWAVRLVALHSLDVSSVVCVCACVSV